MPFDSQWATFLRNHDELTLDQLSDKERQEVFDAFGPDPGMQLYGRGLRRRLPPMLGGHSQRIRMAYSLLFSLPGTPVLFYGEEIGMGENLDVEGRMAVRTPMQWSDEPGAGFSTADPEQFPAAITEGEFGPLAVNVAAQRAEHDSLLNWFERLIRRRRETPELGLGKWSVIKTEEPAVLAHRCDWDGSTVVAVHNFGAEPCRLSLPLDGLDDAVGAADLLDGEREQPLDEPCYASPSTRTATAGCASGARDSACRRDGGSAVQERSVAGAARLKIDTPPGPTRRPATIRTIPNIH